MRPFENLIFDGLDVVPVISSRKGMVKIIDNL